MLWNFKQPKAFKLDWPLVDTPVPIVLILLTYALFVFKFGKLCMQNRKPYNVKNVMLVYNALQVVYNLIMFLAAFKYMFITPQYDFRCLESLPLKHPIKFTEECICYGYFINKILDLTDTLLFVLRKSYKQITMLHVYHHITMVGAGYLMLRFYGSGGHACVTGVLNMFVHVIMYSYYFLSALSLGVRKALWWKRYITIVQIVQFVIISTHCIYVLVFSPHCGYPRIYIWFALTQALVMKILFIRFYVKTYIQPKKMQTVQSKSKSYVKAE